MPNETIKTENLRPAPFQATYILKPDLKLLKDSIKEFGMIYPIIAHVDGYIVDGHARWLAAQELDMDVPVAWAEGTEQEMMIFHILLNRAHSIVVAKDLSQLIKRLIRSGYDKEELRNRLHMTLDEFQVLAQGDLVKRKKLAEHKYNKAWVPVETSGQGEAIRIERPKTPDR